MTLLADSDAAAERHARLLSRRPGLRAATLLRWFEWEGCDWDAFPWQRLHLLRVQGRDRGTHNLVDNLAAGLRSLVIGEFTLASGTIRRLDRCATTCNEHRRSACVQLIGTREWVKFLSHTASSLHADTAMVLYLLADVNTLLVAAGSRR